MFSSLPKPVLPLLYPLLSSVCLFVKQLVCILLRLPPPFCCNILYLVIYHCLSAGGFIVWVFVVKTALQECYKILNYQDSNNWIIAIWTYHLRILRHIRTITVIRINELTLGSLKSEIIKTVFCNLNVFDKVAERYFGKAGLTFCSWFRTKNLKVNLTRHFLYAYNRITIVRFGTSITATIYDRLGSEVIYRYLIDPTIVNKRTNFIKVVGRERRALSFLQVFQLCFSI